jgi:L-ribulose-5-phosphate 3-epimerase
MALKDDISLAQWALVEEFRAGKWTTLDFPRLAREDFGLNGVEFVNTLLEVPTEGYLRQLKQNASSHGITMVLIMVDDEGDGCQPRREGRKEFELFHRKWVDIAHYLGCHAIRTNCRGPENVDKQEALEWAAESYQLLLEYAKPSGVKILIENHGGVSNDADWMLQLMKKTLPFAGGMSYRNQPSDALTVEMIELCKKAGFHGWYGIESDGRDAIMKGIGMLRKWLFGLSS